MAAPAPLAVVTQLYCAALAAPLPTTLFDHPTPRLGCCLEWGVVPIAGSMGEPLLHMDASGLLD
jgi:hypothetical protein